MEEDGNIDSSVKVNSSTAAIETMEAQIAAGDTVSGTTTSSPPSPSTGERAPSTSPGIRTSFNRATRQSYNKKNPTDRKSEEEQEAERMREELRESRRRCEKLTSTPSWEMNCGGTI